MAIQRIKIDSLPRRICLLCALLLLILANFFFGRWALANMGASHADIVEAADLTKQWGPSDPQTH